MSKRKIAYVITIFAFALTLIAALSLQNPPWTRTPFAKKVQGLISMLILSNINVVDVPDDQQFSLINKLPFPKYIALESGNIKVLTATQIADGNFKEPVAASNCFVVATIEPEDLAGKTAAEKKGIIEAVDDIAVNGKIDAIVETTASDGIRTSAWGRLETQRLHNANVLRCVIFDGGHHVGALSLKPDILIMPVAYHNRMIHVGHWFTRDAVPLWKLRKALRTEGMGSSIALFPRFGVPVKNPLGMAMIASQAIIKMNDRAAGKITAPNYGQTLRELPETKSTTIENETIFLSFMINDAATKDDILRMVAEKVKERGDAGKKAKRVYVGITVGISRFPYGGKETGFSAYSLEKFLDGNLVPDIIVLSEPVSAWDIYRNRF